LERQIAYLNRLRKVSEQQLRAFIAGKTMPPEFARKQPMPAQPFVRSSAHESGFSITSERFERSARIT
jgi:hypothetical protein